MATERLSMTKTREILRQKWELGRSYREIATKAASAQAETVAALSSVVTTLAELQAKLNGLEKILKEVE